MSIILCRLHCGSSFLSAILLDTNYNRFVAIMWTCASRETDTFSDIAVRGRRSSYGCNCRCFEIYSGGERQGLEPR